MFFEYYVLYWDDLSEENTVAKGVVYATGITEAYQKLIKLNYLKETSFSCFFLYHVSGGRGI